MVYDPPIPEFSVVRAAVPAGETEIHPPIDGPSIAIVTSGKGSIAWGSSDDLQLSEGVVFFIGAGHEVEFHGGRLLLTAPNMIRKPSSLLDLDDYSLIHLLQQVKSTDLTRCVEPLSSTCRRMRELSMPLLFGLIRQHLSVADTSSPPESYLVPESLWPYIKAVKLRCRCIDGHLTLPVRERYEPQDSDVICGALANPTLHLDRLLRFAHLSLETLSLPTEPSSMETIALLDWPRLRELKLRGLRWTSPDLPIIRSFAGMPNLRVLSLELMEQDGATGTALRPRGFSATYPWPYLDSLLVSHPDPDDEVYAHLPQTMQILMLRSWPHECIRRWQEVNYEPDQLRSYRSPTSPSALLHILRACYMPHLRNLGVEYRSDRSEVSFLSHVASNFPRLTSLELHRYRPDGDVDIPVLDIARSLASLADLRILKIHLDFPEMQWPMPDRRSGITHYWTLENPEDFEQRLRAATATFAQVLKPCLKQVWHFIYKCFQLHWRIYDVDRVPVNGLIETRVELLDNVTYETEWR
ncbi:hypothetical protein K466DRAFT_668312 [Polyporus arcularius HHB13444]|uniref:Phosphomannose isomerase type I C-terminal domain-containing protein n=1 Tax=Polyporus arcularius HHB13444 TaxID=1314778 RepID=A0A5C3NQJ6_9APHY|nr:hypothetical protein K466DRAFT_668312 [Polyporus arcularius HHB13444]